MSIYVISIYVCDIDRSVRNRSIYVLCSSTSYGQTYAISIYVIYEIFLTHESGWSPCVCMRDWFYVRARVRVPVWVCVCVFVCVCVWMWVWVCV